MSNNFDLRKFLTENKLTSTAKAITEWDDKSVKDYADAMSTAFGNKPKDKDKDKEESSVNEYEHHYRKVGGECRKYNDEGDYTVVSMHYCQYNEAEEEKQETPISEMNGGYIEVMGDEFDEATDQLAQVWQRWKNGPATEDEDIEPAKEDILQYIKAVILK